MRTAARRALLGATAAMTLGIVTACGSGDSSPEPLPASEFRERANAVCRQAGVDLAAIPEPASPAGLADSLAAALPLEREQIDELDDIAPPPELAQPFEQALALLGEQLALGQQAVNDLNGGRDPAEVITTLGPEIERNEQRLDELAAELGLDDCASEPASP